jgi:hypothetical protein
MRHNPAVNRTPRDRTAAAPVISTIQRNRMQAGFIATERITSR